MTETAPGGPAREYPLLCIATHCRPAEHGGPRRTARSWFCDPCIERAGENLRFIADAWDDLEEALTRSGGASGEPVKGTREVGLELNEKASAARAKASSELWSYARIVFDWSDEVGRNIATPSDQTTPGLARWLADWHLWVFASQVGATTALAFVDDAWAIRRAVASAAYPSGARPVPTGLRCTEHGTSDQGERVPCEGEMRAWVRPDARTLPDLVCSEDRTHRVDPATWQRAGWRAAPLDPDGMERLARALRA